MFLPDCQYWVPFLYLYVTKFLMMKVFFRLFVLSGLCLMLSSWGGTGHYHISYNSALYMPGDLLSLNNWAYDLGEHASDADDRKAWDDTEAPKHYVNFEEFPNFAGSGRVIENVDSAFAIYGSSFLEVNGYLPWATLLTFDLLVDAFDRNDWTDIVYYAADLGHYVADGHMPLHLTSNYNGQLSNQYGVHSRIESTLIANYLSQILISGGQARYVPDVQSYVFNYTYDNFIYVDSLLDADRNAYAVSGGSYYNENYYPNLWTRCGGQIKSLFNHAAQSIADLILTAAVNGGAAVDGLQENNRLTILSVYPNPAHTGEMIKLPIEGIKGDALLTLYDESARLVYQQKITDGMRMIYFPAPLPDAGSYVLRITDETTTRSGRLMIVR